MKNNVDNDIEINDECSITLLDREQLYKNNETFPNFNYTTKEFNKKVGKVIKIKDIKFKAFRKMIPNIINSKNKDKEELNISDKDFKVSCSNASMFLVIMSLLKDSYSLDVNIFPLMIVNKKCYDLLNFNDCKIKFLRINSRSYLYPVNCFEGNGWIFQKYKENNKESLSAIAIFNFLIYSNFIYSLQELQIRLCSKDDNFEDDFNDLLAEFYKTNF